jgi:hypothetical protein
VDSVLRNTAGTIELKLRDGDGALVDATGSVLVAITDGAGAAVTNGTATKTPATTGTYTFTVAPTYTAVLDQHTATWTGTVSGQPFTLTTEYEVVGANVFTISDLRAEDKALTDTTRYPAERLREAREAAIERFERAFMRAVRPRGRRATLSGDGSQLLLLPDTDVTLLRSVSEDGTALVVGDLTLDRSIGAVTKASGTWAAGVDNVTVHYEYGVSTAPMDVRDALLQLAVEYATPATIPHRATGSSTDQGTVRYTLAGRDGPTGIPLVDAVGQEWGHRRPGVA